MKFSLGSRVRMIELGEDNIQHLDVDKRGGWMVTLFLVTEGRLLVSETHPVLRRPRQLVIEANAAYCTRHHVLESIMSEKGTRGYIIQFEQSMVEWAGNGGDYKNEAGFYRLIEHPSMLELGHTEIRKMEWIFKLLMVEFSNQHNTGGQIISRTIDLLLMIVIRNVEGIAPCNKPVNILIHKFNRLLEQQYRTEKKVHNYARKLFVTAGYLNAVIKRDTGYPVGYHIRKRLMSEALLQATRMDTSVKEVAADLGFSDAAHFSKFFKKETGINFSSYRRQRSGASEAA